MPVPLKTCPKCGCAYDVAFVICGECGTQLPERTVSEVVAAWVGGEHTMYDAVHDSPEVAWPAILEILSRGVTDEQLSLLAAGPLEDLLASHGAQFIERVEEEARRSPSFNRLLGGVWQNQMSQEIWSRVQKARRDVW
jgi:hypothetical protein